MAALRFRATIQIRGVNPYVLVSAARARQLQPGWRRPMPVLVRVNGKPRTPWAINMMPTGKGSFFLYLHGDVRRASGTAVGDRVDVEVRFNPRYAGGAPPMPPWLAQAFRANPAAKRQLEQLTPSR